MAAGRPLTTTQVAGILHCSRQHVVRLCDDGTLPYRRVGTHRRISRADVQKLVEPGLSRDEEQSLWLHYAIAMKLVADPAAVLEAASTRVVAFLQGNGGGRDVRRYLRWQQLLEDGPSAVLDVITSRSANSADLRAASPLVEMLTEQERTQVLTSFDLYQSRSLLPMVVS